METTTNNLEWENYGYANGWKKTPARVKMACSDPDAKIESREVGRCVTEYRCEKYKFTYLVDSSD